MYARAQINICYFIIKTCTVKIHLHNSEKYYCTEGFIFGWKMIKRISENKYFREINRLYKNILLHITVIKIIQDTRPQRYKI